MFIAISSILLSLIVRNKAGAYPKELHIKLTRLLIGKVPFLVNYETKMLTGREKKEIFL